MAAKAHAILSASSSDRWLHCPPSARLCETYEDKGSDYAAEGTDAHALGVLVFAGDGNFLCGEWCGFCKAKNECRASITFYVFNSSGNKGIACGLNNLQKIRDGEPLGGKASAESDFATDDDEDFLN